MKLNFVTYFDSNYLSRGLTLYDSLEKNCPEYHIYIFAFDDDSYEKLESLRLEHASIISLNELEDAELLRIKSQRTRAEYCWSSTPKVIQYVLNNYNVDMCIYIDSDIFFFNNPEYLLDEMGPNDSAGITAHRYSEQNDYTDMAGKYNVQFLPFKNTDNSRKILNWWNERCMENCSIDLEAGVYGDQKYLDRWQELFEGVHELENIGGGVAPWNVDSYSIKKKSEELFVYEKSTGKQEKLVFYHFHNIKFFDKGVVNIGDDGYYFPDTAISYIYKTYIRAHVRTREKYNLDSKWTNQQHFRDDDIDHLVHSRYYFLMDMFL